MAATEFPTARRFSWVLALLLAMPATVIEAGEQAEPSAAGTLVFVTAKQDEPAKPVPTPRRKQTTDAAVRPATHESNESGARFSKVKAPAQRSTNAQPTSNKRPSPVEARTKAAVTETEMPVAKIPREQQIAQMLVHAHRLSKEAVDEQEFDEIAVICSTAERMGATGDQLQFALQLNLWASNQRDSIRLDQLEAQLVNDKSEQQHLSLEKVQSLRAELTKQKLRAQKAEQKLKAEELARQQRQERIAEQREATRVAKALRKEIADLKLRAERAEVALAEQRSQPLEPEPIDVFADSDIEIEQPKPAVSAVANAGQPTPLPIAEAESAKAETAQQSVDWQSLHDEAVTLAEEGRFQQALAKFNRVIELNPMFVKAYSNRATLYAQQGKLELAAADYEQAFTIDPDFLHALVGLGRTYHQLGRLDEALECMNRCIELEPGNAELYCSRADLHSDLGNYREALADYAETIDLAPDFAHAYRNGAWLLATCPDSRYRDSKNAIRGAKKAIEFNYGERHIALDTLAAALASDGQYDEAVRTMQEAMQLAPNDAVQEYRDRLATYRSHEPFFNRNLGDEEEVQTATYEVSDR